MSETTIRTPGRGYSLCLHPRVSVDPLIGGYFCPRCLKEFDRVPDALIEPPRAMGLWQRVKWAFRQRTKVRVVDFVWTVEWARSRQAKMKVDVPPIDPRHRTRWFVERPPRVPFTREQMAKLYTDPSSQPRKP